MDRAKQTTVRSVELCLVGSRRVCDDLAIVNLNPSDQDPAKGKNPSRPLDVFCCGDLFAFVVTLVKELESQVIHQPQAGGLPRGGRHGAPQAASTTMYNEKVELWTVLLLEAPRAIFRPVRYDCRDFCG